jgi:hypothetical protein
MRIHHVNQSPPPIVCAPTDFRVARREVKNRIRKGDQAKQLFV